jgi:hypothetical protein
VIRWFFADGLNGIARKTWLAYQDEQILSDILRYLYLKHEPVMGACVAECLFSVEVGMHIPPSLFDRFLTTFYHCSATKKTTQRLKTNLMRFGLLKRSPGEDDELVALNPSKVSLLLLIHHLFAEKEVRTIELRNLMTDPFWKYLGYKSQDEVRMILREADSLGIIGKYVVADQLEQVTTCLTQEEFLLRQVRI